MSRLTTLLQHPDNVLTVFEARYSEDYYAVVGPSAFAQIMSDALKGGDPDYAHAYYNHVCNTWFPVSEDSTPDKALRSIAFKLETMSQKEFDDVANHVCKLSYDLVPLGTEFNNATPSSFTAFVRRQGKDI